MEKAQSWKIAWIFGETKDAFSVKMRAGDRPFSCRVESKARSWNFFRENARWGSAIFMPGGEQSALMELFCGVWKTLCLFSKNVS